MPPTTSPFLRRPFRGPTAAAPPAQAQPGAAGPVRRGGLGFNRIPVLPPSRAAGQVAGGAGETPVDEAGAPDPWALDGFARIDGTQRPYKVSEEAWAKVFPADYGRARRLAGRFFALGQEPDQAVDSALDEMARENITREPTASRLAVLRPLFPQGWDEDRRLPSPALDAALRGVDDTARAGWSGILASEFPERAWFLVRRWHAASGCCLVCGGALHPDDDRSKDWGDGLHKACRPLMATIGPAYGRLVTDAARARAAMAASMAAARVAAEAEPDDGNADEEA